MIKALLFDVFGTVVDWRSGVAREVEAALEERGIACDWAAFADDWRARYQPAMERVRSGGRGFVPLDVLHRENLVESLAAFGISGLEASEIDALAKAAWRRLDPWPDSVPGLYALKRRRMVAACSNGNVALIAAMARRGGLAWDAILGAEIARAYKPSGEAYLSSAAAIGLEPEACMMVAAHNSDLAAAHALGFATAFIARPDENGPGRGEREPTGPWTHTTDSLEALARVLDA